MHNRLITISLRYRLLVILSVLFVCGFGVYEYFQLPVDAFPDISPVMVPIFTEAEGMAPEEVERRITFPVESVMNGLPGVKQIKSTSAFGISVVYVYFEDDMDMYFARQVVSERLSEAVSQMPDLPEKPALGPISTGLGQIFIYYLTLDETASTGGMDPASYLRDINDWVVKYQLGTVPGVTEILSIGGHVRQYQVNVNPDALVSYQLSVQQVVEALRANNANVGGQYLITGQEESLVRGIGLLESIEDIEQIAVATVEGTPIRIADVARVEFGSAVRRGVVSRNGTEEVVSGIVLQLYGQNTSEVIGRLYAKIPQVQSSLPEGVKIVPYYEQQDLVQKATGTVKMALLQGSVLAAIVLFLFLGNLRAAWIVVFSLPLSVLVSILLMRATGISANLMSLGGIAIAMGMLVDGAIVMVENIHQHLNRPARDDARHRTDMIIDAALEVAKPILFSLLIVVIVFVPILTLEQVEGKMFIPMAYTLCFALLGSLLFAIVIVPALSSYLLHAGKHQDGRLFVRLQRLHEPLLRWAIRKPVIVLCLVLAIVAGSVGVLPYLGTEFIPTLEEGSILIGVTMAPSISLDKAVQTVQALESRIMKYPQVDEVISRIGRPEAGSHPHPVNYAEIHVELHPMKQWGQFGSKAELVEALAGDLKKYPGIQLNFTQPIQNAFDELLSGVKSQIAIKVFGEDLHVLEEVSTEIRNAIDTVDGFVDISLEQNFGQPQIQVVVDRQACSRYGVNGSDVLELVETAVGGRVADYLYLNTRRYEIQVRYQEAFRDNADRLKSLLVRASDGRMVPLVQVARVESSAGPIQINRENNQRRWIIQGNVRQRDLGSVIDDIQERIRDKVTLPPGYYIEYGGQFESQVRAMSRLSIVIPAVVFFIFLMLFLAFGSARYAFLVMLNIPLALTGGIVGLYAMQAYLSVPAAIGFIALFGVAIQDSMVLVTCIHQLERTLPTRDAIIAGCHQRFRSILMTSLTTILGLLPLLLSHGIGAEVQRPLAAVVIFGLSTSTLLTLFVIPAFYGWFSVKTSSDTQWV
ncbi:MAG TPA: CusA/CzcA family heavy metal efflux RND transporter [Anaerohalosphaeraceae bacterium]|nr:CusA/CzcA family heavy metal efflux RND transporter [Anaerohalosphaeraceae bacterium]